MSLTEDTRNEIMRYLRGEMSGAEHAAFESRLNQESEAALREEVAFYATLMEGARLSSKERMKAHLKKKLSPPVSETTDSVPSPERGRVVPLWAIMGAVAAVAAVILLFVFLPGKSDRVFNTYFQPDIGLPRLLSPGETGSLDQAMIYYKSGAYPEAIEELNALLETSETDTVHYFLGNAWLAEGNATEAIPHFEWITGKSDSPWFQRSEWYLALAYLKKGEEALAREKFRLIAGDPAHYYSKEADSILAALNS